MAVSPMPDKPHNVISIKEKVGDKLDKYMIVSFHSSTMVLSIAEEKVSVVTNSGFYNTEKTLHAGILEDNSYI
jgi:hypothetical protein